MDSTIQLLNNQDLLVNIHWHSWKLKSLKLGNFSSKGEKSSLEWNEMKSEKMKSRGWEDNRRALLHNMWTEMYKLGCQHTKAPLAATLSPFVSLLYPPKPWCEWCVKVDHNTGVYVLLFSNSDVGSFKSHKNQISVSAVRQDLRFFILIPED